MNNDPVEKAKASLGEAWRAARSAAEGVKKEIERAGIARSFEDAGREIARATTSVASHLGAELEELGREIRVKAEHAAASGTEHATHPSEAQAGAHPGHDAGARPADAAADPAGPGAPASGPGAAQPGTGTDKPDDPAGKTPPPGGGVRIATD